MAKKPANGDKKQKRETKRRGMGEGAIFQRGDGRWIANVTVGKSANHSM